MKELAMRPGVHDGTSFETVRYPTDEIRLRVVDAGDVQVVEYISDDREGPPAHSHPWDELEYVIEGTAEFYVGGRWIAGGPGTVQMLPAGEPHAVRVPEGVARILMVTIGAPYDGFARDVAAVLARDEFVPADLLAAAARHGVELAPAPDTQTAGEWAGGHE